MTGSELRAVMRMARRTARRQWVRTVLIVLLIAVPVAAAVVAATMIRAGRVTPQEWATSDFGSGEVRIESWAATSDIATWLETTMREIDPDAALTRQHVLHGPIGAGAAGLITDADLSARLNQGRLALVEGEAPAAENDVALAEELVERIGLAVGDEVTLQLGETTERTYRLTGVVRDPLYREAIMAVVSPAGFDAVADRQDGTRNSVTTWLAAPSDPEEFASQLQRRWADIRLEFWPAPPLPEKPQALELIPDEIYFQLTGEEALQLASLQEDPITLEHLAIELVSAREQVVLPDMWVETKSQRLAGFFAGPESALERPQIFSTMIATLLLAEVALVAGAAYATGTRRRLREIGLLGANGATPAHVSAGVIGEGVLGGLLGASAGVAIAAAVAYFGRPIMQRFIDRLIEGNAIAWSDAIGPFVAGIVAATVAAWVPARAAAGVSTLTALQGRMPVKRPARWVPLAGLGMAGFGAFLLVVAKTAVGDEGVIQAALGVLLMIGGVAFLTGPLIAMVGGWADRLPATLRLVVRDSARQRTRAAAAVSALLVVLIAPVVVGLSVESAQASSLIHGLPSPNNHVLVYGDQATPEELGNVTSEHLETVARLIPDASGILIATLDAEVLFSGELDAATQGTLGQPVAYAETSGSKGDLYIPNGRAALASPELVELLGDARIAQQIDAGTPVVLGVRDGPTVVELNGGKLDAYEVPLAVSWGMPRLLLPAATARELAPEASGSKALFVLPEAITEEQQSLLWNSSLSVAVPFTSGLDASQSLLVALLATLVVVLGIIGLVAALAATESDRDIRTIVAVGAAPSIRRKFLGLQTTYYTLAAALLAAPLGWLLMKASAQTGVWTDVGPFGWFRSGSVIVPWDILAVVVVGIPVTVGIATALMSRSLPSALPRRAT